MCATREGREGERECVWSVCGSGEGLQIFRVCAVFTEAVFYNVSAAENKGINRDGHVNGDRLC